MSVKSPACHRFRSNGLPFQSGLAKISRTGRSNGGVLKRVEVGQLLELAAKDFTSCLKQPNVPKQFIPKMESVVLLLQFLCVPPVNVSVPVVGHGIWAVEVPVR